MVGFLTQWCVGFEILMEEFSLGLVVEYGECTAVLGVEVAAV